MTAIHYVVCFIAGLFLCNGIPHLTAGLRGEPFPSPFTKPRGVAPSPAVVNFFWGTFNLLAGIVLLMLSSFTLGWNIESALLAIGFMLAGIPTSWHFEKVRLNPSDHSNNPPSP